MSFRKKIGVEIQCVIFPKKKRKQISIVEVFNIEEKSTGVQAEFTIQYAVLLAASGQVLSLSVEVLETCIFCNDQVLIPGRPLRAHLEEGDYQIVLVKAHRIEENRLDFIKSLLFRNDGENLHLFDGYFGSTEVSDSLNS